MKHMESNIIKLLNTEIYYEIIGEGIPFLMIHGWGVDHRIMSGCMEPIFMENEHKIKRINFDLPGMGRSRADKSIKTSDDVLNVILAFIHVIIPNQPFLLAGESYGGYLARALLQKMSEQILGLLLVCPLMYPGYRKGDIPPLTVLEKDIFLLNSLDEKQRSSFEYLTIVQNEDVWNKFNEDILPSFDLADSEFLNHLEGAFTYDISSLKTPFDKPSLFLMGRQDTEVGWKDQFKLMKDYPRASYIVLDKAGHNLQIEQPELLKQSVLEWLNRVNAGKLN